MAWFSASTLPFAINLVGLNEGQTGDLITRDGEIIGTWILDEQGHPGFIPNGETEVVVYHPFIPLFCDGVADWLAAQEAKDAGPEETSPKLT